MPHERCGVFVPSYNTNAFERIGPRPFTPALAIVPELATRSASRHATDPLMRELQRRVGAATRRHRIRRGMLQRLQALAGARAVRGYGRDHGARAIDAGKRIEASRRADVR